MEFRALSSPHLALPNRVNRIMLDVILALVPGAVAMIWYFGWGVLVNMMLAALTAVTAESLVMRWRGRPVGGAIGDLSALVTALLLGICVPPLLPWWMTVLGTSFAIIVVKQLYGGLGYNPFNPAMAGYVLLLISYPVQMTTWLPPSMLNAHPLGLGDTLTAIFTGHLPAALTWDSISGATPLDEMRTKLAMHEMISEIRRSPVWGDFGARGWEWVANWYLLGGIYLLWRRVITWQIPVSMLGALVLVAGLFWAFDPQTHPFPAFHLFSGGAMLGAFFIATDPVTACTTRKGQLIYGASIGLLVFIIRTWAAYPDAVAFSVLLMNMAAPTIDSYTQPRVFGHRSSADD